MQKAVSTATGSEAIVSTPLRALATVASRLGLVDSVDQLRRRFSFTRRKNHMHFRERGQVVQIIRTSYDSRTKKSKNEIVGRLTKSNPHASETLLAALSTEERKELATWLASHATHERLKKELAVRNLPEQLALAEAWFADQKDDAARVLAAALVPAWVRLRVALKRNGLVE
jgi:hypothetical protein